MFTLPGMDNAAKARSEPQPPPQERAVGKKDKKKELDKIAAQTLRRVIDNADNKLELEKLDSFQKKQFKEQIYDTLVSLLEEEGRNLSQGDKQKIIRYVSDEIFGYGPITSLLQDPGVTEIMVNGCDNVYVEREGKLSKTEIAFRDNNHVLHAINKIITPLGRRIDESSPTVDARLPDGSRVNAIIPPLALRGPSLTIRKFSIDPFAAADLIELGTMSEEMALFLAACVRARVNIVVSGGTGSGKTTTLNVLSSFIPDEERIVTIEDTAELQLQQDHLVTLESRPANIEGKGQFTIRELVINSLRMRPDRIIVFDVALQARGTYRGREFSLEKNLGRSAVFAPGTVFLHLPRLEHRSLPGKKISVPLQLTSTSSLKETIALAGQVEAGRFAASRIVLAPGESKTVRLDLYLFGDLGYGVHRFPLVFSAEDALTTLEPSPLELTLEIVTPGRAFIQNISRFFVRARLPLLILGLAGLIIYAGGLFLYRFLVLPRKKVQGILLYWRTGGSRIERKLPRRLRLSSLHKEEIVINFGPGDSRADLNLHGGDCVSDLLIKTVWISRRPLFLQGWRALLEKHLPVRTVLECTPPGIFEYEGDILTRKELLHADRFKAGGFSFEYRDPGGGWFRNKAKGADVLEGKV